MPLFWVKWIRKPSASYASAAFHSTCVKTCSCGSHPFVMSPNALRGSVCATLLDGVLATSFWPPSKHLKESNTDFFFYSNNGVRPGIKNTEKMKIGRAQEVLKEKTPNCVLCTIWMWNPGLLKLMSKKNSAWVKKNQTNTRLQDK